MSFEQIYQPPPDTSLLWWLVMGAMLVYAGLLWGLVKWIGRHSKCAR